MSRIHDVVRAYLGQRTRQEVIPRNPATHIQLSPGRRPEALVWTEERIERWLRTGRRPSPVMVWTPEQTGLFLDFVAEDRHYALWHLIAFRGLRRGEACSLNRSELSLSRGTASIRTGEVDEPTKNQRSRTIGLDKATIEVLTANRRQQLRQQELLGDLYEDSGLVFTDEHGRPLNLRSVSQWLDGLLTRDEAIRRSPQRPGGRGRPTTPEALASAYGSAAQRRPDRLSGPSPAADLRHGAASLTYRSTRDLNLVSELLGHSGLQITADTYTTLFQEVDGAAAEAVAALVPRGVHTMCTPEDKPGVKRGEPEPGLEFGGL